MVVRRTFRLSQVIALTSLFLAQYQVDERAAAQGILTEEAAKRRGVSEAIQQLSTTEPAMATDKATPSAEAERARNPKQQKNGNGSYASQPSSTPPATNSLPISATPSNDQKQDLGDTARKLAAAAFLVGGEAGTGSAWVISKKHRLLATNAHVADIRHASGGKMVAVQNGTANFYDVEQVWYHPGVRRILKGHRISIRSIDPNDGEIDTGSPDLAILKLASAGPDLEVEFTPASFDELATIFAQPVAILGFPGHDTHGLPRPGESAAATFHSGVVSRVTDFQFNTGTPTSEHQFVQYTMSTWGGFSGSPVFLPNGRVVCVHNSSNFDRRGDEVRSIPHGVRVDCVLEMIVHHHLDSQVSFKIDKSRLQIARWLEPDPRTESARADLAKAAEIVDESNALYEQGDFMGAAKKCGDAIDVLPTYAPAFSCRAGILYASWIKSDGWPTERAMTILNQALDDATRANQLTPGLEIWLQMCRIRNAMTWETDDVTHSQKVLEALGPLLKDEKVLDPLSRASTLQVRGNAYNMVGQNESALADYNECIRLDPKNPGRYEARARFYQSTERSAEASDDFLYADKLRGEGVEVLSEGQWYSAEIIKTSGSRYLVHYKGYGAEWDEWVSPSRIRGVK